MSYFTLFPNSVGMTQLVKTGLRLMLTMSSFVLLKYLMQKYPTHKIKYENFTHLGLYLAYLALGALSLFWSSLVRYSLLQLSMIVEAMVFAWFYYQLLVYYNAISNNDLPYSKVFAWSTFWICLAFIGGLFYDPATFYRQTHGGEVSRLGGFIINPNELGMLAVLGGAAAYLEMVREKISKNNVLILISCVAVLLLTQSRSSLGAFLLVTGICLLKFGNLKLQFASIVGAVFAMPILIREIIVKQGDIEEVMSMTGRLPFWKDLIQYGFTKEPILGYGFMCISYEEKFDSIHAYAASMTHNTFIQVLLNLGLVGAFICLFQMIATARVIILSKDTYLKNMAWLMLVPLIINSITEFGIFGESNYGIQFYQFVLLFFVISAEKKYNKL